MRIWKLQTIPKGVTQHMPASVLKNLFCKSPGMSSCSVLMLLLPKQFWFIVFGLANTNYPIIIFACQPCLHWLALVSRGWGGQVGEKGRIGVKNEKDWKQINMVFFCAEEKCFNFNCQHRIVFIFWWWKVNSKINRRSFVHCSICALHLHNVLSEPLYVAQLVLNQMRQSKWHF